MVKIRKVKTNNMTSTAIIRKQVVDLIDSRRELKLYEEPLSGNLATAGAVLPLTQNIIQGDAGYTRDGNQIQLKELDFRFITVMNNAAVTDHARLIIFRDTAAIGTYPAVTDVLTTADVNSGYTINVKITKRFHIIYDGEFALAHNGNTAATFIRRVRKFKNLTINYLSTGDTENANGVNAVYAIVIGNLAADFTAYQLNTSMYYFDS